MLGLFALGLTAVMIYTLVKNALIGKQLTNQDTFLGTAELLVPVTKSSSINIEAWKNALTNFHSQSNQFKIKFLVEGHRSETAELEALASNYEFVETFNFLMRPDSSESATWMVDQVKTKVTSEIVMIGDSEIVPTEDAFISLGKIISDKNKPYFALPQTARKNPLAEAMTVLNPNLAFTSVFGFRKIRKNVSYPLLGLTSGWMGMEKKEFDKLNFAQNSKTNWKLFLANEWDKANQTYLLAFGEKNLIYYYNDNLKTLLEEKKENWKTLFLNADKTGLWLYLVSIFLWSFPILCFFTHPYWSLASFGLLLLYRFFSKIVFQESWIAVCLHFVGCLGHIGSLGWLGYEALRMKYKPKAQV